MKHTFNVASHNETYIDLHVKGPLLFYFHQFFIFSTDFHISPSIKFYVDPSVGTAVILSGQTDRHTETIDAFCDCPNVPKNCRIRSTVKTSELNNIHFCSTHPLLEQTAFRCSLIIMEVPVKQFIPSPPDFSTYLRQYVAV